MSGGPIRRASQALQLTALSHIESIQADYGGTEIKNVLEWLVKNTRNDMATSVFLLTDGIGSNVSHHLVESVARTGIVKWIDDNMPTSVIPIPWNSSEKNEIKFCQAPNSIPAIYLAQYLDGPIKLNVKDWKKKLQSCMWIPIEKVPDDLVKEQIINLDLRLAIEKDRNLSFAILQRNLQLVVKEQKNTKIELSQSFDIKVPTIETLNMKNDDLVWTTAVTTSYLEIVMKEFKEEWELYYEKAERALVKLISEKDKNSKVETILSETREWEQRWLSKGLTTPEKFVVWWNDKHPDCQIKVDSLMSWTYRDPSEYNINWHEYGD
ncbi:3979_t:CDS:10 [Ambispora leptoticha]|uniref:3979_t:CDS:1 n=1 Tax=Ambispora leptoticha TaxID=144679 RepID=A0A9N8YYE2_9GLOM|nr:3979_t:CDS:10 [Ambispora leptoticha]